MTPRPPARTTRRLLGAALLAALACLACASGQAQVPVYGYRVVNTYPHDQRAFTQGLVYAGGALYEGTGLEGASEIRRVELATGRVLQRRALPAEFFGEGLTLWGNRLVQLTWTSQKGFVYDRESFAKVAEFAYPTEGWGLTHDGKRLILSDGTASLYFLDPQSFARTGRVAVTLDGAPLPRLNELEYVRGEVYANVWQTDLIARIDPATGRVKSMVNLAGLLPKRDYPSPVDVLNGIAYDAGGDRLLVTGKWWPSLYEIELVAPR